MVEEKRDEKDRHSHHHHSSHHAHHRHHRHHSSHREGEHIAERRSSNGHTDSKHRSHRTGGHSTYSRSGHSDSSHSHRSSSHNEHESQSHRHHRSHSHREHKDDAYKEEVKSVKEVDRMYNKYSKNGAEYRSTVTHSDKVRERSPVRSNEMEKKKTGISLTHSGLLNGPSKSQNSLLLAEDEAKPSFKKYGPPEDEYTPISSDPKFYLFKYLKDKLVNQIPLNNYKSFFTIGSKDSNSDIVLNSGEIGKDEVCVIQFRKIFKSQDSSTKISPYLINLSKNLNVLLNDETVPAEKFIQLLNQDVVTFGKKDLSDTEFVLIID